MNNTNFEKQIERMYPGYSLKGSKEAHAELNRLKKEMEEAKESKAEALKKYGAFHNVTLEAQKLENDRISAYEELEKALFSGDAFIDQSIENMDYISDASIFSLREFSGGATPIDENTVRVPMDTYNDTSTAEIVEEGADSTPRQLIDVVSVLNTDSDDVIIFNDTAKVRETLYDDDSKTFSDAVKNSHARAFVNAENKKALALMIQSKDAITLTAETILEKVNASLCGKAKRNAVIITNKNGFASLDVVGTSGYPMIKKNCVGEFILLDKYVVIEMDNEILPNNLDGSSPVIVGDIANVLKFFTIKETNLITPFADFNFNVSSRSIKKEIIKLRTTSDEAYIVGSI